MFTDARSWLSARGAAVVVVAVGILVPLVRMVRIAGQASRTQYNDYWFMLDTLLDADGGIRWAGVLEARNQHPVVVPKLLYVLNIALADGSNDGQQVIVFVLAGILVALVAMLCRGTPDLGRWATVAIVVTAAAAVFAPHGAWSFVKAMSGTAWLTAHVFVVAALLVQQRGGRWVPAALGVLATVSYGTGLVVWPALIVAGVLRDGRDARRQWPVAAVGVLASALYLRWYVEVGRESSAIRPLTTGRRALEVVLGLAGDHVVVASLVGLLAAIVGLAALWAARERLATVAPWVGLVVFSIGSAVLIGTSRDLVGFGTATEPAFGGVPSRYWTVAAWAWIGFVGVVMVGFRGRPWSAVIPTAVVLALVLGAGSVPGKLRQSSTSHDLLAVGMHIGLAEDNRIGGGRARFPEIVDRLRAAGHQPFDGSFDLDCGLLGEVVPVDEGLPDGTRGEARLGGLAGSAWTVHGAGFLDTDGRAIACILAIDGEGRVVGAGTSWARTDGKPHRFRTIAPLAEDLRVGVRFRGDDDVWTVPRSSG